MLEAVMRAPARHSTSLTLAVVLMLGGAGMAPAAEEKHPALDCKLDFDTIKGTAYALPGAEMSEKPDWDMVHMKSRAGGDEQWWIALFVFTQKGHYADPTVTLKSIWKAPDGQVLSESTACGYGDKVPSGKVMAEFADLDRQMNEAIAKEHPEKPKQ
jgi:hypothetical protein